MSTPQAGTGKHFPIEEVLSVGTDYLFPYLEPTDKHPVTGVYDVLNYMTGDSIFTHQIPRCMKECQPHIQEWYPWLAELQTELEREQYQDVETFSKIGFVHRVRHGQTVEVWPIPTADHERIHPIQELVDMVGEERVIVVQVDNTNS